MRFLTALTMGIWVTGWGWANSPAEWNKVDPFLAWALTRPVSELPHLKPILREGRLRAFVRTNGHPYVLNRLGVEVTMAVGNIASVWIPAERLREVVLAPEVLYVEGARRLKLAAPMLEVSASTIGVPALHRSTPPHTGRNVLIGLIDTGLDVTHPTFKTAQGQTRLLAVWDQVISVPGRNPPETTYGTEWTPNDIDSGRVFGLDDPSGHGTHVAGIAAGNGRWTDDPTRSLDGNVSRVGIAPNADILFVKTALLTPDVLDAVAYILIRARQFRMPVVINMSFGNSWGPHDGRGLLNEGLELLAQNAVGVAFVAAAGNDGDTLTHARFTLRSDNPPKRLYFRSSFANESVFVETWQSLSADVKVTPLFPRNAAGDLTDFGIGSAEAGQLGGGILQAGPAKGLEWYVNYRAAPTEYPDVETLYVQLSRSGDYGVRLDENVFALEFSGVGTVDAYVHEGKFLVRSDDPNAVQPDSLRTVGSPAESASVIAVGSYATRTTWLDSEGTLQTRPLVIAGQRSDYSSVGPRRDDFEKPDVLAPGEYVFAPWSSDMVVFVEPERLSPDGRHIIFRGTSLSAAHVTGLVALLLEQNPSLTPAQVREQVRTAGREGHWTPENGTGLIDGFRLLGVPSPPTGVSAEVVGTTATLSWVSNPEPDVVFYRVVVGDAVHEVRDGTRLSGIVLSTSGTTVTVVAVNRLGQVSAPSEPLVLGPHASLAAPTNVRLEPLESRLAVSWNPVQNATRYRVEWGTAPGVRPNVRETTDTTLILDGLLNGTTYYVAVRALDVSGNGSVPSSEVRGSPRTALTMTSLPVRTGFPVETGHDLFGSPAVADVDGDKELEIFVGGADGKIYAYRADGTTLTGWPQNVGDPVVSSVAIGDLNRDGKPEIVATAGRRVHVFNANGTRFQNFPVTAPNLIRAEPVLANLDAEPTLEILVTVAEGASGVYAWNTKGQLLDKFPFHFDEGFFAYTPPLVADRDYNGTPEIYAATTWGPVYGWNIKGETLPGFPVLPEGGVSEHASLVAVDFGEGGLSLLLTGRNIGVAVLDAKGNVASGFPTSVVTVVNAGLAVGDLDGDGVAEILGGDEYGGYLYAWHRDGTVVERYPVSLLDKANTTPLLADLDGDGRSEIVAVGNAAYNQGCVISILSPDGTPLLTTWIDVNIIGTPTLADLDGDGKTELIATTLRREENLDRIKPLTALGGRIFVWNLPYRIERGDWTTHQGSPTRLGVASFSLPAPSEMTNLRSVWIKDRLRLMWTTTRERGNLGYELYRSESPSGPFERVVENLIAARGGNTDRPTDYIFDILNANPNKTYYYRLVNVGSMNRETILGPFEVRSRAEQTLLTPWGRLKKITVLAPFPAPANPEVWIPFRLEETSNVQIVICDMQGHLVRRINMGRMPAGNYLHRGRAAYWDGKNNLGERVASGIYFVQVFADRTATPPKRIFLAK